MIKEEKKEKKEKTREVNIIDDAKKGARIRPL